MRTTFRAREPYADIFLKCAAEQPCTSPARPVRFMEKMEQNRGSLGVITGLGPDEEGLERKNPVIAALGDSVTAGHFETIMPEDPAEIMKYMSQPLPGRKGHPPVEITDARESYIEKFRLKLIDLYEQTSVSVINAGIAGDNLIGMAKRLTRDVIRYQPDLVLVNGVLNWSPEMGTTAEYKEILRGIVRRIKAETEADLILLTPNGDVPGEGQESTTAARVQAVRETAREAGVCLADVYAVWEAAREAGCPWKELLANGCNHPGTEGHEVYALTLMKLFA